MCDLMSKTKTELILLIDAERRTRSGLEKLCDCKDSYLAELKDAHGEELKKEKRLQESIIADHAAQAIDYEEEIATLAQKIDHAKKSILTILETNYPPTFNNGFDPVNGAPLEDPIPQAARELEHVRALLDPPTVRKSFQRLNAAL